MSFRSIVRTAPLLLIPVLGLQAQDEVEVPPPVPAPGDEVQEFVPPDPNTRILEDIIQPKINGDQLAELYRQYTGRRVTVSTAAAAAEIRFIQRAPLTYAEATQLLKQAAMLEGFVFVPDPNMDNHDILVIATAGANPKGEGLEIITNPADLPTDDRVVTYVMDLRYIKPAEVVQTFTTVVGQFGPYGSIREVPNAGSVIITEKTSLIKRLIELKDEIDVSSSVATRFIRVQYADVTQLAETLNEVLNLQQQTQRSAGLRRADQPTAGGAPQGGPPGGPPGGAPAAANAAGAAGGDGGSAAEEVPIQIVPDTRTNRIFAMGRPVDIVFIEGLVAEFDTPTDQRNFLRRRLRFVAVADFLEIAEPALQRAFTGVSESGGSISAGGGQGRASGANFGGNQRGGGGVGANNNQGGVGSNFGAGGGGAGGGSLANAGGGLQAPNVSSAPEARLVGRTLLVADNITNSLVVQGPPSGVEIVENLLDQIDVKAEQVMISAVFGQLALGDDFELGVEYLRTLSGNEDGQWAGRGGSGAFPLLPLDGSAFNPGALAGAGLNLYGRVGDNFNVVINALQEDSRFEVLSRPTIFTSNNQIGTISSGQRIAVPTNSFQGGVSNGISTNVEYQNVFLTLEVVPLVNSPDEVTLQISLVNEELGQDRVIDESLTIPDILSRQIATTVTVPNAATIVLGGLIRSGERETVTGIPLLSEIPWIGGLFSNTQVDQERSELMIFIQPRIISSPDSLYDAQVDMDGRYSLADDSRDFAEGPAVLPNREAISTRGAPKAPIVQEVDTGDDGRVKMGRPGSIFRR